MKLVFKTVIVSIGQFASSAERIVVFMILSRTLSKYDYGTYQQVWLFYLLVSPIFMLGLPSSLLYFIPRNDVKKHKTIAYQALFLLEAVGVVFSLITILTAPLVAKQFNNPSLEVYLRIFAIYPLVALPPKLVNLLMIAEDRPIASVVISSIHTLVTILFITVPSIVGLSLVYTFYGAIVGGGLYLIGILYYISRYYREQTFYWDWKLMWNMLLYSIPLGLSSVLGTLSTQLNKVVVSSTFSAETYATFSNGAFEIPFIGMITGSLMTVLLPEFVKRLKNGSEIQSVMSLWINSTMKTAIFLFPIAISLMVFATDFMVVMFSAKYANSADVFRIYLLLTILRITQYGTLLLAMGKTNLILYTSIFGLVLNLVLSTLSIPILGATGPAWANVVTTYSWAFIYLIFICNLFNISFKAVMPWKELGKLLLLALFAGALCLPILLLEISAFPRLILGIILYSLVYLVLLFMFRVIYMRDFVYSINVMKRKLVMWSNRIS